MKPFMMNLTEDNTCQRTPILTIENARKLKSGMVVLHHSEKVGEHNTNDREELIIVLEGNATLEVEGTDNFEVKSGSVAYIPPNTKHNVINKSESELRYIYIVTKVE